MASSLEPQRIRDASLSELEAAGFRPARWMPLPDANAKLRPKTEIAARLLALKGLFGYVCAPADRVSDETLATFFESNALRPALDEKERTIVDGDRAQMQRDWVETIGWKLENMWPLAWALGFEPAPPARGVHWR